MQESILGISAFYHDSAACLLRDGKIVAAAQEERFTRKKHDARFPAHAIRFCLHQAGISVDRLKYVVFYDKPLLKFERLLETYIAFAPKGHPVLFDGYACVVEREVAIEVHPPGRNVVRGAGHRQVFPSAIPVHGAP
jgi:predicted NodU family carbamoyl transferase